MFVAHTRRSASDPRLPAQQPHFALPLAEAIAHATADSAWACHAEDHIGRLAPGLLADFTVLDRDPFAVAAEALPATRVLRTFVDGVGVWEC